MAETFTTALALVRYNTFPTELEAGFSSKSTGVINNNKDLSGASASGHLVLCVCLTAMSRWDT